MPFLFPLFLALSLITMSSCSLTNAANHGEIVLTAENTVTFADQVNPLTVAQAQVKIAKLSAKLDKNATIYLVIDSPGGSVSAGNQFIDFARALPQKVRTICVFCASMGYHMFQSFNMRLVTPSSRLMSHRASLGGLQGQVPGEFESRLNSIKATLLEMDSFVAKRVGVSLEQYRKEIYDELWLSGTEAVKRNHADALAKITCSKDLIDSTHSETINTIFGPVGVEMSNCPMINFPIGLALRKSGVVVERQDLINEVMKVRRTAVKLEL